MADMDGLPPLPKCFSGVVSSNLTQTWSEKSDDTTLSVPDSDPDTEVENSTDTSPVKQVNGLPEKAGNFEDEKNDSSSFHKLNDALTRLKEEMAGLRKLDVSLLNQLWSLHDAIQEYKTAVQDRYSETNSEYSYGMSRTSSMASIDEYDWNEDMNLKPEGYVDGSLDGSTSSLLQQINQLAERAESEFL